MVTIIGWVLVLVCAVGWLVWECRLERAVAALAETRKAAWLDRTAYHECVCPKCQLRFSVPSNWLEVMIRSRRPVSCPLGHVLMADKDENERVEFRLASMPSRPKGCLHDEARASSKLRPKVPTDKSAA